MLMDWKNVVRRGPRDTSKDNKIQACRDDFDRDYGRVLHCTSFRRLQGKTQVWGVFESDYFRTRLTHSLEAAQIGGSLAKEFAGVPPELVMASCLAHDIGHPPFGHDGTDVMKNFAVDVTDGGVTFDDNAQTFRVITRLEGAFGSQYGLNLTCATIDGTIKYKLQAAVNEKKSGYYPEDEEAYNFVVKTTGTLNKRNPVVMFVELADDIAYACHDLEDALRAQFLTVETIRNFRRGDSKVRTVVEYICNTYEKQTDHYADQPYPERIAAKRLKSRLVDRCITLALAAKEELQAVFASGDYDDETKRNLFYDKSGELKETISFLRDLVRKHVIDEPNVQRLRFASNELLGSYLDRYRAMITGKGPIKETADFLSLPKDVRLNIKSAADVAQRCRALLDYVAGMTDRYLMEQASVFYDLRHEHAVSMRR